MMSSRIWAANTSKQNNILDESSSESHDFANAATSSTAAATTTTTTTASTASTAAADFDDDLDDFEIETFDVAPPDSVLLNTTAISARPQLPTFAAAPKQPRRPSVPKTPKTPKTQKTPKTPKVARTPKATKKSPLLPQVKAEPQRISQFSIVPKVEPINTPLAMSIVPAPVPTAKRRGRPPKKQSADALPAMFLAPFSNPIAAGPYVAPLVAPPIEPKPEPKYVPLPPEPSVADADDSTGVPAVPLKRAAKKKRKFGGEDDWSNEHVKVSTDDEFDLPSKRKRGGRRRRPYVKVGYRSAFSDLTMQERLDLRAESQIAISECFPAPPLDPGNAEQLVAVDEYYNALLAPPTVPLAVPAGLPANIMLSRVHSSLVGKPFGRSQMHAAAAYYAYRGKRTRMIERIGRVRSDITFEGDEARTRADALLPAPQPADTPNGIGGGMERVAHAVSMLTTLSADPTQAARLTREMRHMALLKFRCAEERAATLAAMSTAHWTPSAVPTVSLLRPVTLLDSETVLPILRPVDRYRFAAAQQSAIVAAFGSVNHKAEAAAELQVIAIGDIAQQVASEVPPKTEDEALEAPLLDLPEPEMPEPEF
jgi:hypothetical protein